MKVTHETFWWLKKSNILSGVYSENNDNIVLSLEDSTKLELGMITSLIKQVYKGQLPNESEFNFSNTSVARLYN